MLTPDKLTAIDRHLRKENWLLNEDLITELTDHYANGVSDRLAQGMPIDAAIREIHQNFGGRKGLLNMEEEYQVSQTKQVGRLVRTSMRSYFQLPRLGITVLLLLVVYSSLRLLPKNFDFDWTENWLFIGLVGITVVLYLFAIIRFIGNYRQNTKARNQGIAALLQGINTLFLLSFYVRMWLPVDTVLVHYPLPSAVVITLFVIFELAITETVFSFLRKNQNSKIA